MTNSPHADHARDRAEKARADDYRQQTETVRALLEQRDAARADAERLYTELLKVGVNAENIEAVRLHRAASRKAVAE